MWPSDATKLAIYYFPNDGVSVTVAESNEDFNTLSGDGIREAVEFRPLTPQLSMSDDKAAVIAIEITLFPNQGFCVGNSTHHAIFDGRSSANVHEVLGLSLQTTSLPPELTPLFDWTVIEDPTGIDMVYVNNWLAFTTSNSDPNKRSLKVVPSIVDVNKLVRTTVVLRSEDIKKLRDKILSASDDEVKQSDKLHLSTFALICAYVYTCMVKARGGESNRDVIVTFTADYRTRLDPPVPMNYFGNCVGSHATTAKARDVMNEKGVTFVVERLSGMIKELENGLTLEGFEEKLVKSMSLIKPVVEGATQGLGVTGSVRLDFYASDFAWGKPKKVEIVSIGTTEGISLAESRDEEGGVEIGLVLGQQEMKNFSFLFEKGLKEIV